jgi:uncharacterized protein (DUF4415 family)
MKKRLSKRKRAQPEKPLVRLMLSTHVISYFKSKGPDWKSRIDRVLLAMVEVAEQNR